MARKLAHIVPRLEGLGKAVKEKMTWFYNHVLKQPALFNGEVETYTPYNSGDRGEARPDTTKLVQYNVRDVMADVRAAWSELLDTTYMADVGNQNARADIVLSSTVKILNVPVTNIMFGLKLAENVLAMVKELPTPPTGIDWTWDETQGQYRSRAPITRQHNVKLPQVLVKYDATQYHPAQTEVYHLDKAVGEYTRTTYSGACPKPIKDELIARWQRIVAAYKDALVNANSSVDVPDKGIADILFDFGFEPLQRIGEKPKSQVAVVAPAASTTA